MTDLWGYCERCDRWFPCPVDRTEPWRCAACGVEPLRLENRNTFRTPPSDARDRSTGRRM